MACIKPEYIILNMDISVKHMKKNNKKAIFFLVNLAFILIVSLGCLEVFARLFLSPPPLSEMFYKTSYWNTNYGSKLKELAGGKTYITFDSFLGWTIRPDTIKKFKNEEGKDIVYKSNAQGFRDNKDYNFKSDKIRIAAFGDSFVHCDEVGFEESWPYLLERQLGSKFEVLNFGIGGYGTGQAFLRYQRMGVNFKPDIVIIGFVFDDIKRNVNIFRFLLNPATGVPFSKPRFIFSEGKLKLLRNPVRTPERVKNAILNIHDNPLIEEHDFFYKKTILDLYPLFYSGFCRAVSQRMRWKEQNLKNMCKPGKEAFDVSIKILQNFYNRVKADGATPLILVFSDYYRMKDYQNKDAYWQEFMEKLKELKMNYIDVAPYFSDKTQDIPLERLYIGEHGHPNIQGNSVTANVLAGRIAQLQAN